MAETPSSSELPAAAPAVPRAPRRWLRWAVGLLAAFVTLVGVLCAGAWAVLHSAWLSPHVLAWVPGVSVTAPRGPLRGEFAADRLTVALPRGGQVELQAVRWGAWRWYWDDTVAWGFGLAVDQIQAERVTVRWVPDPAPTTAQPLQAPDHLKLPLGLRVGQLTVQEIHGPWWGPEPVRGLSLSVLAMAPASSGHHHDLQLHGVSLKGWQLQGQARVGAEGPLPVALDLQARQAASAPKGSVSAMAYPGAVDLRLQGPLQHLSAQASARWAGQGSSPAKAEAGQALAPDTASTPAVQLTAELHPFRVWPVSQAQVALNHFNPQALPSDLPRAQWSGRVGLRADEVGVGQLDLALRNDEAGAWDAGRWPLRSVSGDLTWERRPGAQPWLEWLQTTKVNLSLALPSVERQRAAQVTVQGAPLHSEGLALVWQDVHAQALHGAAPVLKTDARLTVWPAVQPDIGLRLQGEVQGVHGQGAATRQVSLQLDASVREGLLTVTQLSTRTGRGSGELKDVQLAWAAGQPWRAKGAVRLDGLDPSVWLPTSLASLGAYALYGEGRWDLGGDWRGQAELTLKPSQWAGAPLQAQASWRSPRERNRMELAAQAQLGANQLQLQGSVPWTLDAQGRPRWGATPVLNARWQWPNLGQLEAWAAFAGLRQLAGQTDGQIMLEGEGTSWRGSAQVRAQGVRGASPSGAEIRLDSLEGQGSWAGQAPSAPLQAQVQMRGLTYAAAQSWTVARLDTALDGTVGRHHGRWHAEVALGAEAPQRFQTSGQIQGGLSGLTGGKPAWQGQLQDLRLDGPGLASSPAGRAGPALQPWLQVPVLPLSWQRQTSHDQVRLGASTLEAMGISLQLNQATARLDHMGQAHEWAIQAHLNSLKVAPWLSRWQPQAGWGGDLMVEGELSLQHSAQQPWQVKASLQRRDGDLQVTEQGIQGAQPQRFGIREARVELSAHDGVWRLTQQLDGRILGDLRARQQVSASSPQRLPTLDDPLVGEFAFQIGSLRPWSNWLPAGWRLGGKMQAWAALQGSLRAPQFTGAARGDEITASQVLTGINIADGRFDVVLDGRQVQLKELLLADGLGGTVTVSGQADLGEQPVARLQARLQRFAALQRIDRRLSLSGDLQGLLQGDDVQASGQLRVDEGLFDISRSDAPTIGDDVRVVNRPRQTEGADEDRSTSSSDAPAVQRRVDVQVGIDLGQRLRIKGRGLEATLQGALQFSTPNNRPSLHGTVRVRDGLYAAYGQRLVIDRGGITFTGPIENPRLDLRAMRAQSAAAKADDVKVGVTITGTAQDPRIRLFSEPAMSETEKLSWLLLGRAPSGLDGADIGLLQTAAVALLSGESGGPSESLVQKLGLDELSVRQTDGTVRETVVNIGKQVSERWYLGYERNLNATTGNWQLIYRAAQRFTLRAQAGDDNALDAIWQFRWNGRPRPAGAAPAASAPAGP
jgi:translocation and assembly module TamB